MTLMNQSPWEIISDIAEAAVPEPEPEPEPESFLSEDQIVDDLCLKLDDAALQTWLWIRREDVILGHHSTGRAIRNTYKLNRAGNPHVVLDDGQHENFPDQMSTRIMKRVWDRARGIAQGKAIPIPALEQIEVRAEQERRAEQEFFRSLGSAPYGRSRRG